MDHRSDLMSAKSKFGNGSECQLRGVGGSSGQAAGDANKGGRSLQPWPHQAVTSAITSGSSYSYSRNGSTSAAGAGAEAVQAQQHQLRIAQTPKEARLSQVQRQCTRLPHQRPPAGGRQRRAGTFFQRSNLLIINKPAMCVFRWCSSASLHE